MKPVFASNVMIADFVRAQAGSAEAQFDVILSTVYTAYYHILKSGNRTQFNLLETACAQYNDVKQCKELVGASTLTPAVKRAHAVYMAYAAALAECGVPAVMKKAEHEALDDAAALLATQFTTMVTIALAPEAKVVKSDDEKAKAKADKEAKKQAEQEQADAELEERVKAEAAKLAGAAAITLADMVRIVANAVRTGQLDTDAVQMLDAALDSVATSVTLAIVEPEAEAAHV